MTDTETKLADALRACLPYVLHFKRKAKREAGAGGLEHFVTKCEALLAAHDTARAQPASVAVTYDMVRIVEHNCPVGLPHLDKQRWKAARLTEMLAAAEKETGNDQ